MILVELLNGLSVKSQPKHRHKSSRNGTYQARVSFENLRSDFGELKVSHADLPSQRVLDDFASERTRDELVAEADAEDLQ